MGYQIIGDIALGKGMTKDKAEAMMRKMPGIKTVCSIEGISGELRQPVVRKIAGNGFETVHKEHGILYNLDVSKVMFSKGNVEERRRLLPLIGKSETVIDMFAGIGYFSLGIAKRAGKVIAIEKNPEAFRYLLKNIKLNRISNIETVNDDCRNVDVRGNRVIMGYFPGTEKFLPSAEKMLPDGGMVHYHNITGSEEDFARLIKKNMSRDFSTLLTRKVKSYSPSLNHYVADIVLQGNNQN